MRTGLVLGGGGVVGIAWEIGVLAALADATGWDPARAPVIVGTSAGALIGAQLRHDRSLDDLVTDQRDGTPVGTPRAAGQADPDAVLAVFRTWAGTEVMDAGTARRVAEAAGRVPTAAEADWVSHIGEQLPSAGWPPDELRITGVSATSGRRTVWTGASQVGLDRAVAASCAVPGLFPAVTVDGEPHIDGGVWSGSNVDAVGAADCDAVVFIGPMTSGAGGIAGLCTRMLKHETAALAEAGVAVRTVEPGERFAAAGMQLMDASRRLEALEVGHLEGAAAAAALRPLLG